MFFDPLSHLVGAYCESNYNLNLALIISFVIVLLFLFCLKLTRDSKRIPALAYLITIVLFVGLTYQIALIIPAIKLNKMITNGQDFANIIKYIHPSIRNFVDSVGGEAIWTVIWYIFRRIFYSFVFIGIAFVGSSMIHDDRSSNGGNRISHSTRRNPRKTYDDNF